MNNERDIRRVLNRRFDGVSNESSIPESTLRRSRHRRRYIIASGALGVFASTVVLLVGVQVFRAPDASPDFIPAATPSDERTSTDQPPDASPRKGNGTAPPAVTVRSETQTIELPAWSYCFGDRCVNGSPVGNPPTVGSADEVLVEFPLREWAFTAVFTPAREPCGRRQQVPLEATGDGRFVLRPLGHADTYDVTLYGEGEGSLAVTFRWTTTTEGPQPEPEARATIVAEQGGRTHSYGVEVELVNLAETPERATASVTVEAADGSSITFDGERVTGRCLPEGTVYWDGPDAKGLEAAKLGDAPFRYTVVVMMDGKRFTGVGTWPADEIRGNEPSIALEFTPDLPRPR